jgi:hypothetical protein
MPERHPDKACLNPTPGGKNQKKAPFAVMQGALNFKQNSETPLF